MDSKGRNIHAKAAHLREEGKSIEALSLYSQALAAYQEEGDALGFAEALADECITLRHLYESTEDKKWLILAKHLGEAAVEIAKASNDKKALSLPLLQLGNVQESLREYEEAVRSFQEASDNFIDDRPSFLASIKAHLAYAEYKNGDRSAKERLLRAIKDLEASEEVKYNKDVWVSGAYMSAAEMLKDETPDEAREYLDKAKAIINSNPELILRKSQFEKLSRSF